MTLSTHAIIGGSLAAAIPLAYNQPLKFTALAFMAGILSHFLLDGVPHWDYSLASDNKSEDPMGADLKIGRSFLFDLIKVGLDVSLGLLVAGLFFISIAGRQPSIIFAGVLGAILPDFLQFAYMKIRRAPFSWLQYLHNYYHYDKKAFKKYGPLEGASLQVFFALLVAGMTLGLLILIKS